MNDCHKHSSVFYLLGLPTVIISRTCISWHRSWKQAVFQENKLILLTIHLYKDHTQDIYQEENLKGKILFIKHWPIIML